MSVSASQLDLFPPDTATDASPKPTPRVRPSRAYPKNTRGRVCRCFDVFLRERQWPYVAVDDAKRAIFANDTAVPLFDFLLYAAGGPNLLCVVLASPHSIAQRHIGLLTEWQKLFGEDFAGAFVWPVGDTWQAITLTDWRGNPNHARPVDQLL